MGGASYGHPITASTLRPIERDAPAGKSETPGDVRPSPLTHFAGPDTSNRWTAPVLPKARVLSSAEKAT